MKTRTPPLRPPETIPTGEVAPGDPKTRGPSPPPTEVTWSQVVPDQYPSGTPNLDEWNFSPLETVLKRPSDKIIPRAIPLSMVPSPLGAFSKEQVEFYKLKEYGDELYKSWLQANGEWHGVPEQPATDEADERPAVLGIRERLGAVAEPEINFCIWAPKMVGNDVFFRSTEEAIDAQFELWFQRDLENLDPFKGPSRVSFRKIRQQVFLPSLTPSDFSTYCTA